MTARPDDTGFDGALEGDSAAKPPRGQAEDGKSGGQSQGGDIGETQFTNTGGAGANAQRGGPAGSESDRTAPGAATHKKAGGIK